MMRQTFRARTLRSIARLLLCAGIAVLCSDAANAQAKPKKKPEPPIEVPQRKVQMHLVSQSNRDQVIKSAAKIDELVEKNYEKFKVTPNAEVSDETFLRRAYLDITGAIPTLKQTETFLDGRDPQKRARLVDMLLNSRGYSSHLYNYWSNILRVNERLANNAPGRPYSDWIKDSIEKNVPYDKWVFEMMTAEGKYLDNPATGYLVRDSGMPLDAMNNTVRIFLGTQIGCAQCHDHPFDRWTRKEFYEIAAFTFGTETRRGAGDKMFGGGNVVNKLRDDLKKIDTAFDGGGKYNRFLLGNLVEVYDIPRALTYPHDYQYTDVKPKAPVTPKTLFGEEMTVTKNERPRVTFANWMTSPRNPRFAKNIANRMWKRAFGIGLIEPVDDIQDATVAENEELLAFLEQEMIRLKFDLKEFQRILYNTKTYQREASTAEVHGGDEYHFPGPVLRRMSPEQVWDSFITLAVFTPKDYQVEPAFVQADLLSVNMAAVTADELLQRDNALKTATDYKHRQARDKDYTYKGLVLARASELPTPLPAGHFLRQFGQSDRESIEGNTTDGSVPQVLQMFNGPITHMLLEPKSLMVSNVMAQKSMDDRVNVIFLTVLSRQPTGEERQAALAEIREHGPAGYGNVVWALVNTREFLFVQ
jgi:hypothetical protein